VENRANIGIVHVTNYDAVLVKKGMLKNAISTLIRARFCKQRLVFISFWDIPHDLNAKILLCSGAKVMYELFHHAVLVKKMMRQRTFF